MALTEFVLYGLLGWCGEVFWTAIEDAAFRGNRDWRFKGHSYLWSFPLYGLAAFLFEPLRDAVSPLPWIARGLIYVVCIWFVEYTAGWTLKRATGSSPWDYTDCPHHLHGLISWDYFPVWFVFGFLLEYLHDRFVILAPHIIAAFGG